MEEKIKENEVGEIFLDSLHGRQVNLNMYSSIHCMFIDH